MRWSLLNPQHTPTQEGGGGRGSMETNLTLVSARQSADLPAPPSPINNSIVHVYKGADYKYSIQMTVFIPAADHKATFLLLCYHRHDLGTSAAQVPGQWQWGHGGRRGNNIIEVHQQRGRALYTSTNNTSVEMEKIFSFRVKLPTILL